VYPAVWLLGAALALTAKVWDRRDRWIGLGVPVALVILGAVLIPALRPHNSAAAFGHSVWLMASRLSHIIPAASALYLAWRLNRGRRTPKDLPWDVPRRPG